jgi:Ca-activated chloride channel family protein
MTFLWPGAIVVVAALPAFAVFYVRLERRKRDAARRHAALFRPAADGPQAQPWGRHMPFVLFLASLAAVSVALMRPQARIAALSVKGTVVLAIDVSTSMNADDARPTRLARAKQLAKAFAVEHADEVGIGLVSFAAHAAPELDPTTGREALFAAIDRLAIRQGTALGAAIVGALAMLLPEEDIDAATRLSLGPMPQAAPPVDVGGATTRVRAEPGSHASTAIVLVSDGQSTTGPDVAAATRLAARLGVRIHTVGVGSADGVPMRFQGWAMRVQLDEPALAGIAAATGGAHFRADGAIDWARIMQPIRAQTPPQPTHTEITAFFAGLAALAAAAGAMLALVRTQRIL